MGADEALALHKRAFFQSLPFNSINEQGAFQGLVWHSNWATIIGSNSNPNYTSPNISNAIEQSPRLIEFNGMICRLFSQGMPVDEFCLRTSP